MDDITMINLILLGIFCTVGGIFALGFLALMYQDYALSIEMKKLRYNREKNIPEALELQLKLLGMLPKNNSRGMIGVANADNQNKMDDETWKIIKKMMSNSPQHPEIGEIEEDDQIIGVIFDGDAYPPELE